jgi:integrase/recombinase XerD
MAAVTPCLSRSTNSCGEVLVRVGVPVLDDYLRFVAARARPNTVLATAYDLVVFFRVVSRAPVEVTSADVLGFITAQRTGSDGRGLRVVAEGVGLSARTVRRRLSSVSGLFAYLLARGDVTVNPVPRGLPTRRERQRPRQGVPLVRTPRTLPQILAPRRGRPTAGGVAHSSGPGDGAGDGVRWVAAL